MKIKVTHSDSPYYGQEAVVVRVKHGVHLDLLVELDDGVKISIDGAWTDYQARQGQSPPAAHSIGVEQARRMSALLQRLKRQVDLGESFEEA